MQGSVWMHGSCIQKSAEQSARESVLDQRDLDVQLDELDARFYDLEGSTDADGLVNAFLRSSH